MNINKVLKLDSKKVKRIIPSYILRLFKSFNKQDPLKYKEQTSKKLIQKVPNSMSAIGHTCLTFYGEYLQELASKGTIEYLPIMGHISDYAGAAAFASGNLFIYDLLGISEPKRRYIAPILLGLVWSGQEAMYKFFPKTTEVFDPKDIMAYWLGVGVACGIDYLSNKNIIVDSRK